MESSFRFGRRQKAHYLFCMTKGLTKAGIRKLIGRGCYTQKKYLGAPILNVEEANGVIRQKILEGKPYMVARFGDGELRAVVYHLNRLVGLTKEYPEYIRVN